MDLWSTLLDLSLLSLALVLFHFAQQTTFNPHQNQHAPPSARLPHTPLSAATGHSAGAGSPLTSPLPVIPQITITPDRPKLGHGFGHKRKSVSFSLSSMDEIVPHTHQKRPPTPYVRGPASPSEKALLEQTSPLTSSSPGSSVPGTPLAHSAHVMDPMGVQKKWLMA
ncbi:hypothetical protein EHS25_007768 [Saitozyma podzolica]|uniref:Uncharacterized protein n=1 Tax=Saitozyma podzolica TaxID=1890683 RepID=A0A427YQP8_9TREE|nr:hypothetical protein EHS25_007768 [Saitozyma podzolica]